MRYLPSIVLCLSACSAPVLADCANSGDFGRWLADFKAEAAGSGLKASVVDAALDGLKPDPAVIKRDRSQQTFAQDFLTFANRKVSASRLSQGRSLLKKNAALFRRIEAEYGVPAEVLTAFWGLETDFGAVNGDFPTIRSLLTLAQDCRRPEMFRPELLSALDLVQKGDLTPAKMRGAWAGEIGQLQLLASRYDQYGVDFDGNGHRDLIHSSADALASGANMLKANGWRAGEPWLQEVKVPSDMDWSQARLGNKAPLSEWAAQGVKKADGSALQEDGEAALLLPMGRNGPAFLAFPNFDVFLQWNESTVYSATAAYFATRLAGAPPLRPGNAQVHPLTLAQTKQAQAKLQAQGFPISKVDGIIGEETRAAVREAQQKLGLPADGYPDAALLEKL
ncbi:lytic murein transglycosylase [Candidatus Thiothrix sp. Deng01]|uniref:Lytic murein transglycosylase n=1 Tax=Candidatus Thiothrix phosphatis TaxID=3112415 RepID=A0ABU6CS94_9GAMM|nr:lytic murein transglycosylase [Candidatus Thiothrix sp. Deng01]MEB4589649.1 lytic murein transglycosylase [Candidatus Thiothrix sp. Deng01]